MTDSATYSVILSGEIKTGFDTDTVVEAFARLFKMPPEKAGSVVGKRFVIKKEVELEIAERYVHRLDSIGLDVRLKKHDNALPLSLEPLPDPPEPPPESGDADNSETAPAQPLSADEMICPKCSLRQPGADECSGCGVIVARFNATQQAPPPAAAAEPREVTPAESSVAVDEAPTGAGELKYFVFPALAAVAGALVWYGLAISVEREFAVAAWAIGGVVGFAAAAAGARGHATGVVCALLVVASIMGGKYLYTSSMQTELAEAMSDPAAFEGIDLRAVYEEELEDARIYAANVFDEASLSEFLVERGYSEAADAANVSAEEFDAFMTFSQPRLEEIAANQPGFDEWRQHSLAGSIEDLSTLDLIVDNLDLFDLLFLFLAVGTAYRLGAAGRG